MSNPFRRGAFKPKIVRIAITLEGDGLEPGHIAVMQFVTEGAGNILPDGAVWKDETQSVWVREPNEWNVNSEVARSFSAPGGPRATGWRLLPDWEQLPDSRADRNAWRDDGKKISIDQTVKEKLRGHSAANHR